MWLALHSYRAKANQTAQHASEAYEILITTFSPGIQLSIDKEISPIVTKLKSSKSALSSKKTKPASKVRVTPKPRRGDYT